VCGPVRDKTAATGGDYHAEQSCILTADAHPVHGAAAAWPGGSTGEQHPQLQVLLTRTGGIHMCSDTRCAVVAVVAVALSTTRSSTLQTAHA